MKTWETPVHIKTALCSILLLCSQHTIADSRSDSALTIYQNSSAEIRVEQFSPQIKKQFETAAFSESANTDIVRAQIVEAMERAYHPHNFQKHVVRAINNSLGFNERRKIVEWLNTSVGRKASLAEAMALITASQSGPTQTIEKAKGLASTSKSGLVNVVELAAMESALQLEVNIFQTSVSAFAANAPQSQSNEAQSNFGNYQIYLGAAESRRNAMKNLNRSFSRSLLTLAYSDFSKAEVKAMISFYGSPTGTRYSVALQRGISDAFGEANRKFEQDVRNIINKNSALALAN